MGFLFNIFRIGYDKDGYDRLGYNAEGVNKLGLDKNGLNPNKNHNSFQNKTGVDTSRIKLHVAAMRDKEIQASNIEEDSKDRFDKED